MPELLATRYPLPARSRRGGITLLEVLISMFVLLVGLLGVASLIPVGKFEVQRGAKIERAAACGRAGFREIPVRGMLNPKSWALANTAGAAVYSTPGGIPLFNWDSTGTLPSVTEVRGFVIDPLGVADGDTAGTASLGGTFPISPSGTTAAPVLPFLPRLTLGPTPITAASRVALSDGLFRWQDDLVFDTPDNPDVLPSQQMQGGGRRLSQGDYSWLVTAIPDSSLVNASNWGAVPWTVSVAVFYKRVLLPPASGATAEGERVAFFSGGTGTGELTLTTAGVTPAPAAPADYLKIAKPGQWMMIAGFVDVDHDADSSTPLVRRWSHKWYRIAAAADIVLNGANYERAVTLTGPDWTVPINQTTAFLFDGIIAVYEKNMKLELDSIYQ